MAQAARHPFDGWVRWVGPLVSLLVFASLLFVIHRELNDRSWHDVVRHLRELPASAMLQSIAFTAGSYAALMAFEALGCRYAGQSVPFRLAAVASFVSYAVGHNTGLAALSGGAVRLRIYGPAGVPAPAIALITGFCAATTALGVITLSGLALVAEPMEAGLVLHLGRDLAQIAGVALLTVVAVYWAWSGLRRGSLTIRGWTLPLPGASLTATQLTVATADLCCAAAALYVMLPDSAVISYPAFAAVFVLAVVAAVVTNIPGGLGVIEAVVIVALPDVPTDELLGRLLAFRIVYYVLPLVLASLVLASYELREHRARLGRAIATAQGWVVAAAPQTIGALVFLAGGVLLLSGATPALAGRMAGLSRVVPLTILEASHLLGSVAGLGLVILSRSLFRRVHEAWWLAILFALAGAAFSLLKGFDYEEALIMIGVAGLLWASRGAFGRRGRILEQRLNPRWVLAVAVLVLAVAWVGFLSHRHVEYSNDLWWTFAFDAHAPRMLRATFTVAVLAAAFVGLNLLSPTAPAASETLETAGERVRAALAHAVSCDALLALSGDKRFFFHPADDAFVMYQVSGRSWIALGDPVGPPQRIPELVWSFRELCDRYGGWSVFYQVPAASLPIYVDAGLALLKLGEEARVPLGDFGLEGSARADLRQSHRRAQRDGAVFEVVPAPASTALIADLRAVSDEWLAGKSAAEKGFSVGYFDQRYLEQQPIAVVRRDGRAVAFANLLATERLEELSIDLMRFSGGAPKGTMDFLFIELMLWGREHGYRWFNLGMAPLAGLEQRPLAPAWHRLAGLVYSYGEHFYNFEGLRHYKQKFHPVWTPKYLATPGGLALPRVVLDVTRLIAGGLPEIVRR